MSAYPIAPSEGFYRTPTSYPHDAFGVDTGGRVRPHTGGDATPTVPNARARAVLSISITRTGYTFYAGNYVEGLDFLGRRWLYIHLASRLVRPGATVREGEILGIVGNTGGSGALGQVKMGVHLHVSLCLTLLAANRILNGLVRARFKGETSAQWARAHQLADPWPIIRDGEKSSAPATPSKPNPNPNPEKGLTMSDVQKITDHIDAAAASLLDGITTAIRESGVPFQIVLVGGGHFLVTAEGRTQLRGEHVGPVRSALVALGFQRGIGFEEPKGGPGPKALSILHEYCRKVRGEVRDVTIKV